MNDNTHWWEKHVEEIEQEAKRQRIWVFVDRLGTVAVLLTGALMLYHLTTFIAKGGAHG